MSVPSQATRYRHPLSHSQCLLALLPSHFGLAFSSCTAKSLVGTLKLRGGWHVGQHKVKGCCRVHKGRCSGVSGCSIQTMSPTAGKFPDMDNGKKSNQVPVQPCQSKDGATNRVCDGRTMMGIRRRPYFSQWEREGTTFIALVLGDSPSTNQVNDRGFASFTSCFRFSLGLLTGLTLQVCILAVQLAMPYFMSMLNPLNLWVKATSKHTALIHLVQ